MQTHARWTAFVCPCLPIFLFGYYCLFLPLPVCVVCCVCVCLPMIWVCLYPSPSPPCVLAGSVTLSRSSCIAFPLAPVPCSVFYSRIRVRVRVGVRARVSVRGSLFLSPSPSCFHPCCLGISRHQNQDKKKKKDIFSEKDISENKRLKYWGGLGEGGLASWPHSYPSLLLAFVFVCWYCVPGFVFLSAWLSVFLLGMNELNVHPHIMAFTSEDLN